MSHNFLHNASFHETLFSIDLAEAKRACFHGCPHCGGPLHQANYPRLGFGVKTEHSHFYTTRFSFCCRTCRRRLTPPSVRFFAQRRFISSVFVLVTALRLSTSEAHCNALARRFGIHLSLSTWKRWRAWWRQLPMSRFWAYAKTRLPAFTPQTPLARSMLTQFPGTGLSQRLLLFLRFLSPLSSGSMHTI